MDHGERIDPNTKTWLLKGKIFWDFPGGPVVRILFPLPKAQVWQGTKTLPVTSQSSQKQTNKEKLSFSGAKQCSYTQEAYHNWYILNSTNFYNASPL